MMKPVSFGSSLVSTQINREAKKKLYEDTQNGSKFVDVIDSFSKNVRPYREDIVKLNIKKVDDETIKGTMTVKPHHIYNGETGVHELPRKDFKEKKDFVIKKDDSKENQFNSLMKMYSKLGRLVSVKSIPEKDDGDTIKVEV